VKEFRWDDWNLEHATKHGVDPLEAERVVENAGPRWPRKAGRRRYMVQGRGQGGRLVQVVYVLDHDGTIFIIHAMPLTTRRRRSGGR
jgi:uncharacterized DUF497 family protein